MKSIILIASIVLTTVLASSVQERWNSVHQQCQQQSGTNVPDEIFEKLKRGDSPALPDNFGIHAFCMLSKLGFQDHNGEVLSQKVRTAAQQQVPSSKVDEIVSICSVNKATKEDTAVNLFGCLGNYRVNIGQL